MLEIITFVSLLVGTFLYSSEMGWATIGKYWAIYCSAFLLTFILPSFAVTAVQAFTVAVYFAHVKLKAANL
jgi:hypothetical protein